MVMFGGCLWFILSIKLSFKFLIWSDVLNMDIFLLLSHTRTCVYEKKWRHEKTIAHDKWLDVIGSYVIYISSFCHILKHRDSRVRTRTIDSQFERVINNVVQYIFTSSLKFITSPLYTAAIHPAVSQKKIFMKESKFAQRNPQCIWETKPYRLSWVMNADIINLLRMLTQKTVEVLQGSLSAHEYWKCRKHCRNGNIQRSVPLSSRTKFHWKQLPLDCDKSVT